MCCLSKELVRVMHAFFKFFKFLCLLNQVKNKTGQAAADEPFFSGTVRRQKGELP